MREKLVKPNIESLTFYHASKARMTQNSLVREPTTSVDLTWNHSLPAKPTGI